ncbi:MAG: zf-HC2 domain-containing protein [Pseudomonadota bacterium]
MTVNDTKGIDDVGAALSGYLDGELTQQERQRVERYLEDNEDAARLLRELRELREQVGKAELAPYGEDKWRETMNDATVQVTRGVGWLLLATGLVMLAGFAVVALVTDPTVPGWVRAALVLSYGGGAVLLVSVLRQRLIERKTDKYNDVEI